MTEPDPTEMAITNHLTTISSLLQQSKNDPSSKEINSSISQTIQEMESLSTETKNHQSVITDILATHLFRPTTTTTTTTTISSDQALEILTHLVTTRPMTYLKPSASSVRTTVEDLLLSSNNNNDNKIEISDGIIRALVIQVGGLELEGVNNSNTTQISEHAHATLQSLSKLSSSSSSSSLSFTSRTLRQLSIMWKSLDALNDPKKKSVVYVRCASCVIDLLLLSCHEEDEGEETSPPLSEGGSVILNGIIDMARDENDPLVQMSALDLMERVANSSCWKREMEGMSSSRTLLMEWLFSEQVLELLLRLAGGNGSVPSSQEQKMQTDEEQEEDAPHPILGGTALRILSLVTRQNFNKTTTNHNFLTTGFHRTLLTFLHHSSGELDRLAFIDAVSSLASSSPTGRHLILSDDELCEGWLSMRNVSQPKLKGAILHSLSMALDPSLDERDQDDDDGGYHDENDATYLKLFHKLGIINHSNGGDTASYLLTLVKSPLVPVRLSAMVLIKTCIKKLKPASHIFFSCAGFYEFLIIQEGEEGGKEGKERKFELVVEVSKSPVLSLLDEEVVKKLKRMVERGPFFVEGKERMDVMAE